MKYIVFKPDGEVNKYDQVPASNSYPEGTWLYNPAAEFHHNVTKWWIVDLDVDGGMRWWKPMYIKIPKELNIKLLLHK